MLEHLDIDPETPYMERDYAHLGVGVASDDEYDDRFDHFNQDTLEESPFEAILPGAAEYQAM